MSDVRNKILERHQKANWRCEYHGCNERATQIAHIVNKGKTGRRVIKKLWYELFGEELKGKRLDAVIHHDLNTAATCSKHNSYVLINIDKEDRIKELLCQIKEEI